MEPKCLYTNLKVFKTKHSQVWTSLVFTELFDILKKTNIYEKIDVTLLESLSMNSKILNLVKNVGRITVLNN